MPDLRAGADRWDEARRSLRTTIEGTACEANLRAGRRFGLHPTRYRSSWAPNPSKAPIRSAAMQVQASGGDVLAAHPLPDDEKGRPVR